MDRSREVTRRPEWLRMLKSSEAIRGGRFTEWRGVSQLNNLVKGVAVEVREMSVVGVFLAAMVPGYLWARKAATSNEVIGRTADCWRSVVRGCGGGRYSAAQVGRKVFETARFQWQR